MVATSLHYSDIDTSLRKMVSVLVRFANHTKKQYYQFPCSNWANYQHDVH